MVVQGCSSQPKWIEYEGQFATKDFKKAQDEIPFTIIMPTYLPYSQQDESIADIQGPLKEYQGDEIETKVKIGNRGIRENLLYF